MMRWLDSRGGRVVAGGALIAGVLCALGGRARAQSGDVESLLAQGIELRRKGHPDRAVVYFQKAYDLERTPRTEGQLGLGQIAAGDPLSAERHLSAALESPRDPWVAKYKPALEDALARTRKQLGAVTVDGGPAGASVTVNGRAAGTLPIAAPIRVAAGKVDIEVSAPNHASDTRSLTVAGGETQHVTVTLKETATKAAPKPGEAAPGASGAAVAATSGSTAAPTGVPSLTSTGTAGGGEKGNGLRTAAWGVGAGAVVGLGVGLGLQLAARSKISDFNGGCEVVAGQPVAAVGSGRSDCSSLYDGWKSEKTISIVGYVAGGALAVTSGILFWMSSSSGHGGVASAHFTCAPGPGSLACRGEF